ncbi:MAG TPA: DUF1580 domain-containing protein [Gemmataceae bacterium]|nr:DUF1580 domain-containing protein [Gemmataceae bacterium]
MIDINTETLLPLAKAAKRIPPARDGKRCHASTILRWILKGSAGVKLEAIRLGGRWLTSVEALQRFAEQLTPNVNADPPPRPRSAKARERRSQRAAQKLERAGI